MTHAETVSFYVDLWKKSIEVQEHFNDIEWRIRGLALTVATFSFGAAAVAARDFSSSGFIVGFAAMCLGLLLWYAFYFVDAYWYHPLLKASVDLGTKWEVEFQKHLPLEGVLGAEGMTAGISRKSANEPLRGMTALFSRKDKMSSTQKLVWFYRIGATAFGLAGVGMLVGFLLSPPPESVTGEQVTVRIVDDSSHVSPPLVSHTAAVTISSNAAPTSTESIAPATS